MRVLWLLPLLGLGCLEADVYEARCDNRVDDDLDGLIDCQDPDCVEAELCEDSFERCRDGRDNDRDGFTDCFAESCAEAGACDPFTPETPCDFLEQTGCPAGMGCWPTATGEARCAPLAGAVRAHTEACDPSIPVSGGCRPGAQCAAGYCKTTCTIQADCGADSTCLGTCSIRCIPSLLSCPGGLECVALQTFTGIRPEYPEGGLFACAGGSELVPTPWGTGRVGDPCNPEELTRPASFCARDLVCVPNLAGVLSCRATCALAPESGVLTVPCEPGQRCWPTFPSHPSASGPEPLLGTCWPEGER